MLGLKNSQLVTSVLLIVGLVTPTSHLAFAETMSSTNFKIQTDVMSIGGNRSTSTNFIADDTVGDLATGEDLTSTNFRGCAGYECFKGTPYLSFSVKEGTSAPGTAGVGVALGTAVPGAVATSDGSSINSIFITLESNASGGTVVTTRDANAALARISTPSSTILSATATLVGGTAGYGICVFSNTQHVDSPTAFSKIAPYASTCTKTTGHSVGGLTTTAQTILQATGALKGGSAEILVKAAISSTTPAGADYADTVTFIATGTF